MIKNRRMKQAIAFGMAVVMSASINFGNIVNEAATIEEYYKKSTRITMSSSKGIKKVTVNGKKIKIKKNAKKVIYSFTKQGKYVVKMTNKQNKTVSKIIYIDKTAPVISGVEDGKTYDRAVTISVSDNFKVQSATLNGRKFDGKYTIGSEGDYIVIVTDCAGNKESVSFTVKFANTSNSGVNYGGGSSSSNTSPSKDDIFSEELEDESTVTPKATPIVTKIPTPVATKVPTPVVTKIPTPVATKVPTPVVTQTPTPVATKAPTPVVTQTPTPVITKVPTPVVTPTATPIVKEHVWKEVNRFDATCTKDGAVKYVCTDCGEEKYETIKAVGHHVYTDKTVEVSAATPAEDATYRRVCDNCGEAEDVVRVDEGSHKDHIAPVLWYGIYYKDIDDNSYTGDYIGAYSSYDNELVSESTVLTEWNWNWSTPSLPHPKAENHKYAVLHFGMVDNGEGDSGLKNVQVMLNTYSETIAKNFTLASEEEKIKCYLNNYKETGYMDRKTGMAYNVDFTGGVPMKFVKQSEKAQFMYLLAEDYAGNIRICRTVRVF